MADRMPAPAISWTQSVTVIPTAIFFAIGLALLIVGGCAARKTASFSTPQQLALERRTAVLDTVKSNLDGVAIESSETQACEILETRPPLVIRGPIPAEWPIALTDVQALALQQSQVLRDLGGQVIHSPATVTSDLDRAILTHDPQFGTPAALSAFDRSYGAQVFYDRTDRAFNNATLGGGAFELQQDLITAQARTLRRTRDGSEWILQQTTLYDDNNRFGNLFPSSWETYSEASVRKPLLRGAGVPFNTIAGPQATPGFRFSNGIEIARINEQMSETDFEIALTKYLRQVEVTYWQLYAAYHEWQARTDALLAARRTYEIVRARHEARMAGAEADKEAQARYQCLVYEELVGEALNGSDRLPGVFESERRLRKLIGLTPTDGRLMRPNDEPPQAPVHYEWSCLVATALQDRAELRKQAFKLQQQQLQYIASRNFLLPRLDVIGTYRVRGFGDDLTGSGPRFASATQDLASLDHQEWRVGMEMDMPSGFRQGHAAVQHARLQIQREEAIFAAQKQQVTHELSDAVGRVAQQYEALYWAHERITASEQRMKATQAQYEAHASTVDLVLESQEAYFESLRQYHAMRATYASSLGQVQIACGHYLKQW